MSDAVLEQELVAFQGRCFAGGGLWRQPAHHHAAAHRQQHWRGWGCSTAGNDANQPSYWVDHVSVTSTAVHTYTHTRAGNTCSPPQAEAQPQDQWRHGRGKGKADAANQLAVSAQH